MYNLPILFHEKVNCSTDDGQVQKKKPKLLFIPRFVKKVATFTNDKVNDS